MIMVTQEVVRYGTHVPVLFFPHSLADFKRPAQ